MKSIAAFYDNYDEESRLKVRRTGQLESLVTREIIEEYIDKGCSILELGAGSGEYSLYFAEKEHSVTAIEISTSLVSALHQKKTERDAKNLQILNSNAVELNIPDKKFDVILCLGPYYHTRKPADRKKLLQNCYSHLSDNGYMFIAYINKHFAISLYHRYGIELPVEVITSISNDDFTFESNLDDFLDIAYFCDADHVEAEATKTGLEVVDHVAVDGHYPLIGDTVERLSSDVWESVTRYHRLVMRDKEALGFTSHGLVVCRRKSEQVAGGDAAR